MEPSTTTPTMAGAGLPTGGVPSSSVKPGTGGAAGGGESTTAANTTPSTRSPLGDENLSAAAPNPFAGAATPTSSTTTVAPQQLQQATTAAPPIIAPPPPPVGALVGMPGVAPSGGAPAFPPFPLRPPQGFAAIPPSQQPPFTPPALGTAPPIAAMPRPPFVPAGFANPSTLPPGVAPPPLAAAGAAPCMPAPQSPVQATALPVAPLGIIPQQHKFPSLTAPHRAPLASNASSASSASESVDLPTAPRTIPPAAATTAAQLLTKAPVRTPFPGNVATGMPPFVRPPPGVVPPAGVVGITALPQVPPQGLPLPQVPPQGLPLPQVPPQGLPLPQVPPQGVSLPAGIPPAALKGPIPPPGMAAAMTMPPAGVVMPPPASIPLAVEPMQQQAAPAAAVTAEAPPPKQPDTTSTENASTQPPPPDASQPPEGSVVVAAAVTAEHASGAVDDGPLSQTYGAQASNGDEAAKATSADSPSELVPEILGSSFITPSVEQDVSTAATAGGTVNSCGLSGTLKSISLTTPRVDGDETTLTKTLDDGIIEHQDDDGDSKSADVTKAAEATQAADQNASPVDSSAALTPIDETVAEDGALCDDYAMAPVEGEDEDIASDTAGTASVDGANGQEATNATQSSPIRQHAAPTAPEASEAMFSPLAEERPTSAVSESVEAPVGTTGTSSVAEVADAAAGTSCLPEASNALPVLTTGDEYLVRGDATGAVSASHGDSDQQQETVGRGELSSAGLLLGQAIGASAVGKTINLTDSVAGGSQSLSGIDLEDHGTTMSIRPTMMMGGPIANSTAGATLPVLSEEVEAANSFTDGMSPSVREAMLGELVEDGDMQSTSVLADRSALGPSLWAGPPHSALGSSVLLRAGVVQPTTDADASTVTSLTATVAAPFQMAATSSAAPVGPSSRSPLATSASSTPQTISGPSSSEIRSPASQLVSSSVVPGASPPAVAQQHPEASRHLQSAMTMGAVAGQKPNAPWSIFASHQPAAGQEQQPQRAPIESTGGGDGGAGAPPRQTMSMMLPGKGSTMQQTPVGGAWRSQPHHLPAATPEFEDKEETEHGVMERDEAGLDDDDDDDDADHDGREAGEEVGAVTADSKEFEEEEDANEGSLKQGDDDDDDDEEEEAGQRGEDEYATPDEEEVVEEDGAASFAAAGVAVSQQGGAGGEDLSLAAGSEQATAGDLEEERDLSSSSVPSVGVVSGKRQAERISRDGADHNEDRAAGDAADDSLVDAAQRSAEVSGWSLSRPLSDVTSSSSSSSASASSGSVSSSNAVTQTPPVGGDEWQSRANKEPDLKGDQPLGVEELSSSEGRQTAVTTAGRQEPSLLSSSNEEDGEDEEDESEEDDGDEEDDDDVEDASSSSASNDSDEASFHAASCQCPECESASADEDDQAERDDIGPRGAVRTGLVQRQKLNQPDPQQQSSSVLQGGGAPQEVLVNPDGTVVQMPHGQEWTVLEQQQYAAPDVQQRRAPENLLTAAVDAPPPAMMADIRFGTTGEVDFSSTPGSSTPGDYKYQQGLPSGNAIRQALPIQVAARETHISDGFDQPFFGSTSDTDTPGAAGQGRPQNGLSSLPMMMNELPSISTPGIQLLDRHQFPLQHPQVSSQPPATITTGAPLPPLSTNGFPMMHAIQQQQPNENSSAGGLMLPRPGMPSVGRTPTSDVYPFQTGPSLSGGAPAPPSPFADDAASSSDGSDSSEGSSSEDEGPIHLQTTSSKFNVPFLNAPTTPPHAGGPLAGVVFSSPIPRQNGHMASYPLPNSPHARASRQDGILPSSRNSAFANGGMMMPPPSANRYQDPMAPPSGSGSSMALHMQQPQSLLSPASQQIPFSSRNQSQQFAQQQPPMISSMLSPASYSLQSVRDGGSVISGPTGGTHLSARHAPLSSANNMQPRITSTISPTPQTGSQFQQQPAPTRRVPSTSGSFFPPTSASSRTAMKAHPPMGIHQTGAAPPLQQLHSAALGHLGEVQGFSLTDHQQLQQHHLPQRHLASLQNHRPVSSSASSVASASSLQMQQRYNQFPPSARHPPTSSNILPLLVQPGESIYAASSAGGGGSRIDSVQLPSNDQTTFHHPQTILSSSPPFPSAPGQQHQMAGPQIMPFNNNNNNNNYGNYPLQRDAPPSSSVLTAMRPSSQNIQQPQQQYQQLHQQQPVALGLPEQVARTLAHPPTAGQQLVDQSSAPVQHHHHQPQQQLYPSQPLQRPDPHTYDYPASSSPVYPQAPQSYRQDHQQQPISLASTPLAQQLHGLQPHLQGHIGAATVANASSQQYPPRLPSARLSRNEGGEGVQNEGDQPEQHEGDRRVKDSSRRRRRRDHSDAEDQTRKRRHRHQHRKRQGSLDNDDAKAPTPRRHPPSPTQIRARSSNSRGESPPPRRRDPNDPRMHPLHPRHGEVDSRSRRPRQHRTRQSSGRRSATSRSLVSARAAGRPAPHERSHRQKHRPPPSNKAASHSRSSRGPSAQPVVPDNYNPAAPGDMQPTTAGDADQQLAAFAAEPTDLQIHDPSQAVPYSLPFNPQPFPANLPDGGQVLSGRPEDIVGRAAGGYLGLPSPTAAAMQLRSDPRGAGVPSVVGDSVGGARSRGGLTGYGTSTLSAYGSTMSGYSTYGYRSRSSNATTVRQRGCKGACLCA